MSYVGQYVDRFEKEIADYTGAKKAIATVNGTTALQIALQLAGVEPGDEVITQPLTFVATANAIAHSGADPVFIDVDKDTLGMSPRALEDFLENNGRIQSKKLYNKKTGRRIAAVVPVHTLGHPCRIHQLVELAQKWDIPLVEDAAEALGSWADGQHCGTLGELGILSFNGNKPITCGGGGIILTSDEKLAGQGKYITTTAKVPHKWEFYHDEIGYNYRLPNLNAALACAQMERFPRIIEEKRMLAREYSRYFETIQWGDFLKEPEKTRSNYWLCSVVLSDRTLRDKLLKMINEKGIMARPVWQLMTELPMYRNCFAGPLENSQWLQQRVVCLPSGVRAGA